MERNKLAHFRSWVTSYMWYSPVKWLGSADHASYHMQAEEKSDIHIMLSEAENIFCTIALPLRSIDFFYF